MTYTLLIDQEQVKLNRIRNALKCFATHLWITKDTGGHIWPLTSCHQCDRTDFCRRLRLLIEERVN